MAAMISIRPARTSDQDAIFKMLEPVIGRGDSLVRNSIDVDGANAIWFGRPVESFVAEHDGTVVGAYCLRPILPGLGSHVANATYVVDEKRHGEGAARSLGLHSITTAANLGYLAIQLSCVASTNRPAIGLWKSLGFRTIGTLPGAFMHKEHGEVSALIMHRFCDGRSVDRGDAPTGEKGLLDRLLRHDAWTSEQLLLRCQELSNAELDHDFDMGHRTVRATFQHIIHNMEVWSLLMDGQPVVRNQERSPNAMLSRLRIAAERIKRISHDVARNNAWNDEWLDVLETPPKAKAFGTTIAHVVTHSMHHRAQLLYMMRRLGLEDLPEGDVFSSESASVDGQTEKL